MDSLSLTCAGNMGRLQKITPKKRSTTISKAEDLDVHDSHPSSTPKSGKRKRLPSPASPPWEDGDFAFESEHVEVSSPKKGSKPQRESPKSAKRAKKTPSPSKPKKPPATDPSTWRKSRIGADTTITKGNAVKIYRLDTKIDFEGLLCNLRPSNSGYTMLLYHEREVERRAWEKHGSPEAFEFYRKKLDARRGVQSHDGLVYMMRLPSPKVPDEMRKLLEEFHSTPWLQNAIDQYVARHNFKLALSWNLPYHQRSLEMIRTAFETRLQDEYPTRPTEPHASSKSFKKLEILLKEKTECLFDEDTYYCDSDNDSHDSRRVGSLSECTMQAMEDNPRIWSRWYKNMVNKCVAGVVEEHGQEHELYALWMVYDAHARCLGGLKFDLNTRRWVDPARVVFDGPLVNRINDWE